MNKKIIAVLLIVATLMGIFSSCASSDNSNYMSMGEFFSLFIESRNLYSTVYTAEDLENSNDYSIETVIMQEWGLVDPDQVKNTDKYVTKEIVAQVCVRDMLFAETCDVKIKDIKKVADPEAIRNAVGMGIVDLEDGYFNAKKKMTAENCIKAINKMIELESDGHYEEGELTVTLKDDVTDLSDVEIYDLKVVEIENELSGVDAETECNQVKTLEYKENDAAPNTELSSGEKQKKISFLVKSIDARRYELGKKVTIPPEVRTNMMYSAGNTTLYGMAGIVVIDKKPFGSSMYEIIGVQLEFPELIEDDEPGKGLNKANCLSIKNLTGDIIDEEYRSKSNPKISVDSDGISFEYKMDLTCKEDKYKGVSDYRNAEINASATVKGTISNFKFDTYNLGKLIYKQEIEANAKLSYDSELKLSLESGDLRYSPANNGNSGLKYDPEKGFTGNWDSALKQSRLTSSASGGSKEIKLFSGFIPIDCGSLGGALTMGIDVFLNIEFDGSMYLTVERTDSYLLKVTKTTGGFLGLFPKYKARIQNESTVKNAAEVNANLTIGLHVIPNIGFFGESIIDADLNVDFNIYAYAGLFYESENTGPVVLNQNDCESIVKANPKMTYCIDTEYEITYSGTLLTSKSIIGNFVIKTLKLESPKIGSGTLWSKHTHYENGEFLSGCTRGGSESRVVEVNGTKITLETYKYFINEGGKDEILVESVPMHDEDMKGDTIVSSSNKEVVTVTYSHARKAIEICGVGEGSAEVTIKIPKKKKPKSSKLKESDYYKATISVKVEKEGSDPSPKSKDEETVNVAIPKEYFSRVYII